VTEVTPGNDRDKLLKWARMTDVIGKRLLEVALVYTMLLGILMLLILVVGSC
jgi:hypothetical protein